MKTKAALDALTDQAIAHLRNEQRHQDPLTRHQVAVARDLAGLLLTQFGDDAPLAGRIVVAVSQALAQLIREMQGQVADYQVAPVMANVLAFAGEQTLRQAARRKPDAPP